ncbi:MAG: hypothetical protein US52_C0053G0011 [candidate division WS6 bacterium GW2011_GWA2_37_6]|uniref:Uncharacterized protein n=1 Tax=candidate division WS6 bacterium GW2011_GWA2_37_6 TaxID=1619087 RepID=A0A0G0GUB2_9BACT|nr:MAG: hypothetical protein US52_C0053G0011 [candidate division WS6 bacterium GW2011_GWA2_37_6]
MLEATIKLEDLTIIARRSYDENTWTIFCEDEPSGRIHVFRNLSDIQAGAIIGLAIGSDELEGKSLYEIAEPLMIDCPKECRPIP